MRVIATVALAWALSGTAGADGFEEHDYLLNCAGCHRIDGSGSRTVPSLEGIEELSAKPGTREYLVRVPGAAQAPLSDERLAALMNWLVRRFTGLAPKPPYTAAEVKRLRAQPFRDPTARRKAILRLP